MSLCTDSCSRGVLIVATCLAAACRGSEPARNQVVRVDSTNTAVVVPGLARRGWLDAAGPAMLVPAEAEGRVMVVWPSLTDDSL